MAADIVIRGGTVVDGTGAPGRVADVAIAGRGDPGDRRRPARRRASSTPSGCVVAPGFIDIHTHYDAQVFWDPALRPSSYQGVTTVVAGNCGFTIAPDPARAPRRDRAARSRTSRTWTPASLTEGIVWEFQTLPRVPGAGAQRGARCINFTAYVGHSSVRLVRDGRRGVRARRDRRRDRADVPARRRGDRRRRRRVLDQLRVHPPRAWTGSPSRVASPQRDEVEALFLAAGSTGQGRGARHRRRAVHLRRHVRVPAAHRAAVHVPAVRARRTIGTDRSSSCTRRRSRAACRCGRRSRRGRSPCSSRWTSPFSLNVEPGVRRAHGRRPRRRGIAAYRDPAWRARAAADLAQVPMRPRWETCEVSESARFPELEGRRVDELARERGCGPLDVICEVARGRGPADAVPHLHRQRRRRTGARPAHPRAGRARPLRRRCARRPALRRAAADRPARHVGARAQASCRSSGRCAS